MRDAFSCRGYSKPPARCRAGAAANRILFRSVGDYLCFCSRLRRISTIRPLRLSRATAASGTMGKLSDVCGTRVVLAGAGVAWLGLAVTAAPLEVELLLLLLLLLGLLVGAGGCSGLFHRGRGGFLGRGGLFLGLPAYGEGRQTMDGHDQLAILKGGLQQFGIAVVLQVGDKEVVVVCLPRP